MKLQNQSKECCLKYTSINITNKNTTIIELNKYMPPYKSNANTGVTTMKTVNIEQCLSD